ncbi:MAG: DUF4296 domain-containing protein [Muribaculaceae bacterium]|nr:DUF4296 domain-containing protein [Muribaculaceae bacterium]
MTVKNKRGRLANLSGPIASLSLIMLLIAIVSCSRPSGVLSEDRMVDLLVDMELTEAYSTQVSLSNDERVELGQSVLDAHGVSQAQLDTTLAWYGRNMDKYSELFEKVDKEIMLREKHYTTPEGIIARKADELWPYSPHLVISPLSGYESMTFSLPQQDLEKGSLIEMSFFLPNAASLKGILGVEYRDGYGESTMATITNRNRAEFSLQTDTSRQVARIYGVMLIKDMKSQPLYIDSIALKAEPVDTLNYRQKRRSQKHFGAIPEISGK